MKLASFKISHLSQWILVLTNTFRRRLQECGGITEQSTNSCPRYLRTHQQINSQKNCGYHYKNMICPNFVMIGLFFEQSKQGGAVICRERGRQLFNLVFQRTTSNHIDNGMLSKMGGGWYNCVCHQWNNKRVYFISAIKHYHIFRLFRLTGSGKRGTPDCLRIIFDSWSNVF